MNPARRKGLDGGPGALELIEEAVHLLRSAPPLALAIYYAGTVPFVLGLLYFWAHTTWFAPRPEDLALQACGLTLAFAVMKTAHAEFCARLLAQRMGTVPPAPTPGRLAGLAAAQMRLQAWGFLVLPAAAITVIPLGWAYAYFQSLSVLGDEESASSDAVRQCQLWPTQNHLGLVLFLLLGLAAAINVAAACAMIPGLARSLLGLENLFGFSSDWFGNSTFIASVFAVGWLVCDPVVKTFYTLRVFHGRSRVTGEDLRIVLRTVLARRGRTLAAALVLLAGLHAPAPLRAAASGAAPGPAASAPAVKPAELDAAIQRVLAGADFQWQLRPLPQPIDESAGGPIGRFVRSLVKRIQAFTDWVSKGIARAWRWLMDWLFPKSPGSGPVTGGISFGVLKGSLTALIAAALVALGVVLWKRRKDYRRPVLAMAVAAAAAPDLEDERTRADQLSADGWLTLAREQLARGEWRLAWRALYLGTLARFAAEGLLSLARSKTNLDYEREVRRRAAGRDEVAARFAGHRASFESVWYGRAEADEAAARRWLSELEKGISP